MIKRWIILPDIHVPFQDDRSLAAVESYMAANRYDGWLQIGDLLDFDMISAFNMGKPRLLVDRRINKDFDAANAILNRHQAIIRAQNPKAKFVLLEGNHEYRVERWLDVNPVFEGLLNIPKSLDLTRRGIEWVPSWSQGLSYSIGKATFIHGLYENQYHAKKMVDAWGESVFYGHTHDMMCIPRVTRRHKEDITVGQSIGCLCNYEQQYLKGVPTRWQQGFMELFVQPNGNFTYYTPRLFDHQFIGPDGVLYKP